MSRIQKGIFALLLSLSTLSFGATDRVSAIEELNKKAQSESGLKLEIHGASHESRAYVGTYNFDTIFNALHVSLVTREPVVREIMATLGRHDSVRVWGKLLDIDAPQPHLSVQRMVIEKKFDFPGEPLHRDVDWKALQKELEGLDTMVAEVHAVAEGGKLFVVEYKGFVFPIFNKEHFAESANLSRQDFVRLYFGIQEEPGRPIHFELKAGPHGKAIEVVDSIAARHGSPQKLSGELVLFPQSPTIKFNVFAIRVDSGWGIFRTYTIINFQDPELFADIRKKLQTLWDARRAQPDCVYNDRNKLANRCLIVEVKGTLNHIDPNQANPQLLVENLSDVREN